MRPKGISKTPAQVIALLTEEITANKQVDLAKAIGISQSALSRYLRGIGEPTIAIMQRISDYTGKPITIELKPRKEEP